MEKLDFKGSITSSDDEIEINKTQYSGVTITAGTSRLDQLLNIKAANTPKYLLLEDSTLEFLPNYVNNMFKNYYNNKINPAQSDDAEIIMLLVYCIALETGFTSNSSSLPSLQSKIPSNIKGSTSAAAALVSLQQDNNSKNFHGEFNMYPFFWGFSYHSRIVAELAEQVPNKIQDDNNKNLYKFNLKLLNVTNINCLLTGLHSGEYLILTLTVENLYDNVASQGKSICLSIPRYVLAMESNNLAEILRNLGELSFKLKDEIFIPTRNLLMETENKLYPGLTGLPGELLNIIFDNLRLNELQNLSKSCWKLRCYCVDYFEYKYKPKSLPYGSKNRLNTCGNSNCPSKSTISK